MWWQPRFPEVPGLFMWVRKYLWISDGVPGQRNASLDRRLGIAFMEAVVETDQQVTGRPGVIDSAAHHGDRLYLLFSCILSHL